MTDAPKLKPCPFCGSTNIGYAKLSHVCLECGAMAGPILVDKETQEGWEKLDAAWNNRTDIADELAAALEEVLDGLGFLAGGDYELEGWGIPEERGKEIRAALAKYRETET